MTIVLLSTIGVVTQVAEEINCAFTWSLLFSVLMVNVFPVLPEKTLFTYHLIVGLPPPFTGCAVNVAEAPEHIVVWPVLILTEGIRAAV